MSDADLPQPPPSVPLEAHPVWWDALSALRERGVQDIDETAVAMMCVFKHRHDVARAEIERLGLLLRGSQGPMLNPLLRVERDSAAGYLRFREALGLGLSRLALAAPAPAVMVEDTRPTEPVSELDQVRADRERRRAGTA